SELAVAVLVSTARLGVEQRMAPVTVRLSDPRSASRGNEATIIPIWGVFHDPFVPASAARYSTCGGSLFVSRTLTARSGLILVTVTVWMMWLPVTVAPAVTAPL